MRSKEVDVARTNVLRSIAKVMSKYEFKVEDLRPYLSADAFDVEEEPNPSHSSDEAKAYFESMSPPSDKDVEIENWKLKMILV